MTRLWRRLSVGMALAVLMTLLGGGAGANPAPGLAAEEAVLAQLDLLQAAGTEPEAQQIEGVWAFAHPENRARTGPPERFLAMLRSPAYAPLLGHRARTIEPIAEDELGAGFLVTVEGADGALAVYAWFLIRGDRASCYGCWLTAAVAREALPPSI